MSARELYLAIVASAITVGVLKAAVRFTSELILLRTAKRRKDAVPTQLGKADIDRAGAQGYTEEEIDRIVNEHDHRLHRLEEYVKLPWTMEDERDYESRREPPRGDPPS